MDIAHDISWIFLSLSMASELEPTDYRGISMIADGLNHSIPSHKEIQTSVAWLTKNELVCKSGKKYKLTTSGKKEIERAYDGSSNLLEIWKILEERLNDLL